MMSRYSEVARARCRRAAFALAACVTAVSLLPFGAPRAAPGPWDIVGGAGIRHVDKISTLETGSKPQGTLIVLAIADMAVKPPGIVGRAGLQTANNFPAYEAEPNSTRSDGTLIRVATVNMEIRPWSTVGRAGIQSDDTVATIATEAATNRFDKDLILLAAADPVTRPWNIVGSAGIQFDDNVTTDETDSSSNQSDKALVLEFGGTYSPAVGKAYGLELGYDFSQTLYEDLSSFDLQSHSFSASVEREFSGVDTGLIYLYSRTFLAGDDFLGLHSLTPTLGYGVRDWWYVSLRYNYQNKDFISADDDGRDSSVNSGTVDNFLFFMEGKAYLSVGYRAEKENADDNAFDYLGHFFHARLKMPVPARLVARWKPEVQLGYEYYTKNYSSVTTSIGDERQDDRTTVTLGLSADITKRLFAKFDFEHIEAVSNLSSSDFDENVVTLALGVRY